MVVATKLDQYTISGELPAGDSYTVRFSTPGNPDEILAESQQFDITAVNTATTASGENGATTVSNDIDASQAVERQTFGTNPDTSETSTSTTLGEFRPVPQVVTTVVSSETETSDTIATATVGDDESSTVTSSGDTTSGASPSGSGTVTSSGLETVASSGSGTVALGTPAPSHKASGSVGRGWFLGDAWGVGLFVVVVIGVVIA
jgi:hypothetical protein